MNVMVPIPLPLEQALLARASADKKSVADALVDAAARDLGVELPTRSASSPHSESQQLSPQNGDHVDTSKTTYTRNEYGAIIVRPATTDADGNPLPKRRDLSFLSEGPPLEPEVIQALEEQRRIDPEMWQ